ncbi:MAG: ABC transporter permease [Ruminococcaceae bacterium]|nr:ABC transporter permease [Oscillospiraceae bacterium]
MMNKERSVKTTLLNAPYVVWSVIFIIIPLLMVAYYTFTANVEYYDISFTAPDGTTYSYEIDGATVNNIDDAKEKALEKAGVDSDSVVFDNASAESRTEFTTEYFSEIFSKDIARAFGRSFLYSLIATALSLVLAYPFAYVLSRSSVKSQKMQMMLIMLPMWMSMLVRTYSWMNILEKNGLINNFFGLIGLEPVEMLGTPGAVILGMVYNYLPYMILPIYTVMSKIEPSLHEAAEDLGCNWLQKFRRLILPLSVPGIISGIIMVFVPSISTFYISQKMSNGKIVLIGDLIEARIKNNYADGGINVGAAMSLVLMIVIFICTIIMNKFSDDDGGNIAI